MAVSRIGVHALYRPRLRAPLLALALTLAAPFADGAAHRARGGASPVQVGVASVESRTLDGNATASGQAHDGDDLTAAHRTLPLGSEVRVTNLRNGRAVVVRIDDLSPAAARAIGLSAHGKGVTRVRVEVIRSAQSVATAGKSPR